MSAGGSGPLTGSSVGVIDVKIFRVEYIYYQQWLRNRFTMVTTVQDEGSLFPRRFVLQLCKYSQRLRRCSTSRQSLVQNHHVLSLGDAAAALIDAFCSPTNLLFKCLGLRHGL